MKKNLFITILLGFSLTACGSQGEIYESFEYKDLGEYRTIEIDSKLISDDGLTQYVEIDRDDSEIRFYENDELVQYYKYTKKNLSKNNYIQEHGPWEISKRVIYQANGMPYIEYQHSEANGWIETTTDVNGNTVSKTRHKDGITNIDRFIAGGRLVQTQRQNENILNQNGLIEFTLDYFGAEGFLRIREHWQQNLVTDNGETYQSGSKLWKASLYDESSQLDETYIFDLNNFQKPQDVSFRERIAELKKTLISKDEV